MRHCLEESYGQSPVVNYLQLVTLIVDRAFPLNLVMDREGKLDPECKFKNSLRPKDGISTELGYHTAHIVDVGLDVSSEIGDIAIDHLKLHFIRLMSPVNMMVVPMQLKGLADLACFRAAALRANEAAFGIDAISDLQPEKKTPPEFASEHSSASPNA